MGRTKTQIKAEMTNSFMQNPTLAAKYEFVLGSSFDLQFSLMSLENIIFEIVAFVHFLIEKLFDTHKKELNEIIEAKMPHRPSWYRTKAKAFQYGHDLIFD